MSKLRQAAQALCDRWDTALWKDVAPTAVFIGELRAAIAREEAQTVEPVAEGIVSGALFDFLGFCTSGNKVLQLSGHHDAGQAVDALRDWAKTRNLNLDEARVKDWQLFTHQTPATGPVKPPENCGTGYCSCVECVKPAKPPAGEREALIHWLRERSMWDGMLRLGDAADMLAADAQWKELRDPAILHANLLRGLPAQLSKEQLLHLLGTDAPAELAQQVAVPQGWRLIEVTKLEQIAESWDECSYDAPGESIDIGEALRYAFFLLSAAPQPPQADHPEVELSDGEIYSRMSKAIDARLNIRVPMTDDEIYEAWDEIPDQLSLLEEIILLARAIEQFHGIGVKP